MGGKKKMPKKDVRLPFGKGEAPLCLPDVQLWARGAAADSQTWQSVKFLALWKVSSDAGILKGNKRCYKIANWVRDEDFARLNGHRVKKKKK